MKRQTRTGLLAPAGLLVGPALWAVATQAGQILPYFSCASRGSPSALLTLPAALAALGGAWISWKVSCQAPRSDLPPDPQASAYPASFVFVARISALAGVIFAYALLLQGLAGLVLTGCER